MMLPLPAGLATPYRVKVIKAQPTYSVTGTILTDGHTYKGRGRRRPNLRTNYNGIRINMPMSNGTFDSSHGGMLLIEHSILTILWSVERIRDPHCPQYFYMYVCMHAESGNWCISCNSDC